MVNKKAGEFYTPRSVVHLIGLLVDTKEKESVYDPACGTGGMLLECINHHGIEEFSIVRGNTNDDSNHLLEPGDFLFARTADPKRSYYYKKSDGKCIYAGYLIKFPINTNLILPEYLFYYTKTRKFKKKITAI